MNNSPLFDTSIPFSNQKLALLEQTVMQMYSSQMEQASLASQTLEQLKEQPEFWIMTDTVLYNSGNIQTKLFCLMAIKSAVETKWNILPEKQKGGLKKFIVDYIFKIVSDQANRDHRVCLGKANSILVEIIKKEWNTGWTSAISDLVNSSLQNQDICENNFHILKELSQEIFEFSKHRMTSQDIVTLKTKFGKEFESVYKICDFVLKGYLKDPSTVKTSLLRSCLETLCAFLSWMPLVYVFYTDLIEGILVPLMVDKRVYLLSLKCMEEIVCIKFNDEDQETQAKVRNKLMIFISDFIKQLIKIQPLTHSFKTQRELKSRTNTSMADLNQFDMFCNSLSQILSNFLKTNMIWLEENTSPDMIQSSGIIDNLTTSLNYLVNLTEVHEAQLFKINCDFWHWYSKYLNQYKKDIYGDNNSMANQQVLVMNASPSVLIRRKVHNEAKIMHQAVIHLLLRVPRPEEVLVTVDANGIPVQETQRYAQSTQLYEVIKEIFRNYARVQWVFFSEILRFKIGKQFDGSEWSFNNINSFCWAVGTLSETLSFDEEKMFLIYLLRNLLQMCERKKDVESKVIIASNIMHIVSQFSRFLTFNIEFLKTVIYKLFEFMKNKMKAIKDMASNVFLKISKQCKNSLAQPYTSKKNGMQTQNQPFVISLIPEAEQHMETLDSFQMIQFYESIGHMISAYPDQEGQIQLLIQLMAKNEHVWQNMMNGLNNLQNFMNDGILTEVGFYLRINERLAECIGKPYSFYFNRSFNQIDKLYQGFYQLIQNEIQTNGPQALQYSSVKKYRAVRRDLLNLLKTFVKAFSNNQEEFVTQYGELIMFMLKCYETEIPELREPEVILFMAESVNALREQMEGVLSKVMSSVLEAVLPMITKDFSSFPDHRTNFFIFIQAMVNRCFQVFFSVQEEQFKTVINCVIWAIKHELPTIYEIGLSTLVCILQCLSDKPDFSERFYQHYFQSILADTLFVLTDGLHSNGFTLQCQILFILFQEIPRLNCQLIPAAMGMDNKTAVYEFIVNTLSQSFGNLAQNDHRRLLEAALVNLGDFKKFKQSMRDYLVSLNLFTLDSQ
jgi:exportin-1